MSWIDIEDLTRLTYQNIRDFYTNMSILYAAISTTGSLYDPDYNANTSSWETTGQGTLPTDILNKMNRTEWNLFKINFEHDWVNPYYGGSKTWTSYTSNKYELVKRWIDFINLEKRVIDGAIPMPEYLMGFNDSGSGSENITDSSGADIVCYGEEYFT